MPIPWGWKRIKILASDLYLYCREKGRRIGAEGKFIGSPRLMICSVPDGTLRGFLTSEKEEGSAGEYGAVYALFDNEEIGSGTKQGADFTFLSDMVDCICDAYGLNGMQKRDLFA